MRGGALSSAWLQFPDHHAEGRRELDLRHLALRLLETITGEKLNFESDAAEDVRLRQIAQLRARFERR